MLTYIKTLPVEPHLQILSILVLTLSINTFLVQCLTSAGQPRLKSDKAQVQPPPHSSPSSPTRRNSSPSSSSASGVSAPWEHHDTIARFLEESTDTPPGSDIQSQPASRRLRADDPPLNEQLTRARTPNGTDQQKTPSRTPTSAMICDPSGV